MKKLFFTPSAAFLLILLLVLESCTQKPVYEETIKLTNSTWERFDIKKISFPVDEEDKTYCIQVIMKTNPSFAYDEFPIYVILTTPSGEERMREISVKIDKTSNSRSNQGSTTLWKEITISNKGTCKLSIESLIPKHETPGLDEISIVVNQVD